MKINKITVFNKNDEVYTLIYTINRPNLFFLAKTKIIEIQNTLNYPVYIIKILDLYDSYEFINKYFMTGNFKYASGKNKVGKIVYTKAPSPNRLRYVSGIESKQDILNLIHGLENYSAGGRTFKNPESKHYLLIESPYCFKTKQEAIDANVRITNFHITETFKNLVPHLTRKTYTEHLESIYDGSIVEYKNVLQDLMYHNKYKSKENIIAKILDE